MKIIGITRIGREQYITLKTDSSLLINRHPFFVPSWDEVFVAQPCVVFRVSRLGKSIEARFADRYYDKAAYGLNFRAEGALERIRQAGGDWSYAMSFDYSLCVGEFVEPSEVDCGDLVTGIDNTLQQISAFYTIRQGDYIFVDRLGGEEKVIKNQLFRIDKGQQNLLYCKVK